MSRRAVAKKYFAKCNCLIINEHQKAAWGHCALETDCTGRTAVREVSRAGETWEATPSGGKGEVSWGIWVILKPGYGLGGKKSNFALRESYSPKCRLHGPKSGLCSCWLRPILRDSYKYTKTEMPGSGW